MNVYASGFLTEYYNGIYSGIYDERAVTPVSVNASTDTPNINFTLDRGGSISGHLYQTDGKTPVAGAVIQAQGIGTYCSSSASSNPDGGYSITNLEPGNYQVSVMAPGFLIGYFSSAVGVTIQNDTPNINFNLDRGGSISGHVYLAGGVTPIGGAVISINSGDLMISSNNVSSNADGSYSISGLPTGNYTVHAYCPGLLDVFYNGIYNDNFNAGTPVSVTNPLDTPGIDFKMEAPGAISGHVYAVDGITPLAGIHVVVTSQSYLISTGSNSDGSYSISVLTPDFYTISAGSSVYSRKYYADTYDRGKATQVAVTVSKITSGIDFALEPGGSISGHVYDTDGITPLKWGTVAVKETGNSGQVNADGSYTITGLPSGNYTLGANYPGYVQKYYRNTYAANSASLVNVTAPNNTPDIDFSMEKGGSISGYVYYVDGKTPLMMAQVQAEGIVTYSNYTLAFLGSYTLASLPTGNYTISASAPGYGKKYYNGTITPEAATPVAVIAPNATQNINFNLEMGDSFPASQKWYLDARSEIMKKAGDTSSGVNIANSGFKTWLSDQIAQNDVKFPAGIWNLKLATTDWSSYCSAQIGDWDGNTFNAFNSTPTAGVYSNGFITLNIDVSGLVKKGHFLALRVFNSDSGAAHGIITQARSYLSSPPNDPGYPLSTSSAAAPKLAFARQPGHTNVAGINLLTQPIVAIQDANGNTVTNYSGGVTLTLTGGTGTSGASLSGNTTIDLVSGTGIFTSLSINLAGKGYTLTATCGDLAAAVSIAFDVVHPGDANGDGKVNIADVTWVERIILGLEPLTPGADANGDGKINMADVTKIERIILGLP